MSHLFARRATASLALTLLPLAAALAAGVSVRYDAQASPFPSNLLTAVDYANVTYRRVNLPKPVCATQPSDCADIDVLNTLDGFSTQPRITVPFDGDIDVSTVNSDTVYLINLGDTVTFQGAGDKVGINQILWDPASQTLVFEPEELLAEHARYLLVVTNGVRDAKGKKLKESDYEDDLFGSISGENAGWDSRLYRGSLSGKKKGHGDAAYLRELRDALRSVRTPKGTKVVAASYFTTQSTTGDLTKVMRQIKQSTPSPANFMIGNGNTTKAVFDLAGVIGGTFSRQTGAAPVVLTPGALPISALYASGSTVGKIAYGKFNSPNYQVAGGFIPPVASGSAGPTVQGSKELVFQLFVPVGTQPAAGWPVAIFGHGFTDSMYGAPWTVASVFASRGIATLSINVVGHGGGALGKLNVTTAAGATVEVPAGGRGFDQNGNGVIDSTEGVNAASPRESIGSRDGLRQTVIDLMQLVRQVEVGMDVDGDNVADLDAQRIYYAGQSFGGIYGTMLLGVEPHIKAGVPNVPGGSITEVARLGAFRGLTGLALGARTPSLLNLPTSAVPFPFNFNENMPLRNLAPVVNNVPGAMAIAEVLDRFEWVQQSGNPVSYAAMIRKQPLSGSAAKPVIVQFAKGDQTVPNPTSSALIRAGGLQDRTTLFRNDLAHTAINGVPKNPHTFLTNIGLGSAAAFQYAVLGQGQIADFFLSNGAVVSDPDGAGPIFEVPIALPLPEALNFIP
jgi:hypothetical protein